MVESRKRMADAIRAAGSEVLLGCTVARLAYNRLVKSKWS